MNRRPVQVCECGDHAWTVATQGYVAFVDVADQGALEQWTWHVADWRKPYAVGNRRDRLHRVLMSAPKHLQVDHVNGNGLDNRRINLRLATNTQNARNQGRNITNTSGHKGVSWAKSHSKWTVRVRVGGRKLTLGYFADKERAAYEYRKAALAYFGEFANDGEQRGVTFTDLFWCSLGRHKIFN